MAKNKKEIDKYCLWCEHAEPIMDDDYVLCKYKGIVAQTYTCKKFIYDPLKRNPKRMPKLPDIMSEIEENDK